DLVEVFEEEGDDENASDGAEDSDDTAGAALGSDDGDDSPSTRESLDNA
ncbi:MAG: hypothetical protein JWO10_1443, partial [Microbacteriaceae bacterium]|nr:hypothetical protein [Microbacteriaceae bacterium]